jgi:hypothetical protein
MRDERNDEMRRSVIAAAMAAVVLASTGVASALDFGAAMQAGGDRLAGIQNADGGWGWELTGSSAPNTVGPIGMGLASAYRATGDAAYLPKLQQSGTFLLAKTNNFSPSDGYLAAELDSILGGSTYTNHVKANYFDPLAAGTYNRNGAGTLYTTASYINLIQTARSNAGVGNMATWDIAIGAVSAASAGADTSAWVTGLESSINAMQGGQDYDVLGTAGAVFGLAVAHENFDPTTGPLAAASNLSDMANILATYQIAGGGFSWRSDYVIPNDGDETVQETAYSMLALNAVNGSLYQSNIAGANAYLRSVQLGTGGWKNYLTDPAGENNEITGEALWALQATPEPTSLGLLALGACGLLIRRRRA